MGSDDRQKDGIDVNATVTIHQKVWPFTLLGLFFLLCAAAFAWGTWMGMRVSSGALWLELLFGASALASLAFAFVSFRRASPGPTVAVTLSPDGYRDRFNRFAQTVPWPEIVRVDLHHGRGAHLRLTLSETMGRRIDGSGATAMLKRISWLSLRPILATRTNFLDIRPERLLELTKAYATAHGGLQNDQAR